MEKFFFLAHTNTLKSIENEATKQKMNKTVNIHFHLHIHIITYRKRPGQRVKEIENRILSAAAAEDFNFVHGQLIHSFTHLVSNSQL